VHVTTERSFGAVIRDIGGNVDRIVRAELRMAVAEWRMGLDAAGSASQLLVTGVVAALLSAAFFLLGVTLLLGRVMPVWLAAFVVSLAVGGAAAACLIAGRDRFTRGILPRATHVAHAPEPDA